MSAISTTALTDASALQPPKADWTALLGRLTSGRDLDRDQAREAMADILAGRAGDARIAGLLVALAAKGETVEELTGFALGMLEAAEGLTVDERAVDIVGTGGSAHRRAHALNVSSMACIVASAAGAVVCLHKPVRGDDLLVQLTELATGHPTRPPARHRGKPPRRP